MTFIAPRPFVFFMSDREIYPTIAYLLPDDKLHTKRKIIDCMRIFQKITTFVAYNGKGSAGINQLFN